MLVFKFLSPADVLPKQVYEVPNGLHYVPVGIHHVQYGLELGIGLALLHHGQVVAERPQTRLEFLVVQLTALVLVEMSDKHTTAHYICIFHNITCTTKINNLNFHKETMD